MPKGKKKTKAKEKTAKAEAKPKKRPGSGPKASTKGAVERGKFEMELDFTIDAETRAAKGVELANVCQEREAFMEERRAENAAANDKRRAYDDRIAELSAAVQEGTEKRLVPVIEYLFPTNEIMVIRQDTLEVVPGETRTAKAEDLQEGLFEAKKGKNAEAKAAREAEEKAEAKSVTNGHAAPAEPARGDPDFDDEMEPVGAGDGEDENHGEPLDA